MNKKKMMALMALGLFFAGITGITLISAQIEDTPDAPAKACHIYPIKNPNNYVYPSSVGVVQSFDVHIYGCQTICNDVYNSIISGECNVCVDHYGCTATTYKCQLAECKGKRSKIVG